MNAIEALNEQCRVCEPCRMNAKIIDFKQLPEHEKLNFDWYEEDRHYLIYCELCKVYKLLGD